MKKIIIFKEHHGSVVLDWSSPEQQQRSALSVVIGRFSGNNDYYPMEAPEPPPEFDYTAEDIDRMPPSMKDIAREKFEEHRRQRRAYEQAKRQYDAILKCIETKDGSLALRIINARSSYEDEGFQVYDVHDEYPV